MSSEASESLNVVLGQIEDELKYVKSARDQVDSVLAVNGELRQLVGQCGEELDAATEALAKEAGRLGSCSTTIEQKSAESLEAIRKQTTDAQGALERKSAESLGEIRKQTTDAQEALKRAADSAVEGVSAEVDRLEEVAGRVEEAASGIAETVKRQAMDAQGALEQKSAESLGEIRKQAADAQETLKRTADSAVEGVSTEVDRFVEATERVGSMSSEIAETVRRQATDAQDTIEQAASSAVDRASSSIAEISEQAIANFNVSIDEARQSLVLTLESMDKTAAGLDEGRMALLETNKEIADDITVPFSDVTFFDERNNLLLLMKESRR